MSDKLHTIIISGSDQTKNARKLKNFLQTSLGDGKTTVAGLKAVMEQDGCTNDDKLYLYVEDRLTTGVSVLTSPGLKKIVDAKTETADAGIQISGEDIQLKGSRLNKLLEDQKGKVMLICFENIPHIPECLEDIETDQIIKVEPAGSGLINEKKLKDAKVDAKVRSRLSALNARN